MITYTEIPTEVARDIFNLTVALSKRNIHAAINFSPLFDSCLFSLHSQNPYKQVYCKLFERGQDWTKEYELMSEEIKSIIDKLEEKK